MTWLRDRSSTARSECCSVETRLANAVCGTTAWSSSSELVEDPTVLRTPITVKVDPLIVSVRPIGLPVVKSSAAVVAPSTTTGAELSSSAWVKNRPSAVERARTPSQLGVVPTTLVVQLVLPLTSDVCALDTGATAAMSGAVGAVAKAAASRSVSVDAEPRPPRMPPIEVELPGETISRLLPSELIWALTCADAPCPRPTVSMTAAMPIRMPSIVRAERIRRVWIASKAVRPVSTQFIGPAPSPRPVPRSSPSRIRMTRRAWSATSGSCVIRTMVRPDACSSANSDSTSAVECESRLPVGSSARISAGSVTRARATATRCCWPPDSSPGRCSVRSPRPDPRQRIERPLACARSGGRPA